MPFYSIAPGCLLVEAANAAAFPATGAANTIYIAQDTNTLYRWTGSAYVVVSASPEEVIEAANLAAFPATGEAGKLYVAIDTGLAYRWTGSVYVEISAAPVQSVAGKTGVVTLARGDVGLGNVDNTSDANKPVSTATQTALDGKAAASHSHDAATASVAGFMAAADKSKLDGIASGATANATDAQLRDRSTHTGTQAISTVIGLQTALDGKQAAGSYAAASHSHSASDITSGTIDTARLGSGTANATTFLRGDQTYATVFTNVESFEFSRTTKPASASGSNGLYTWSLPSNAKLVEILAVGGGGGGGGGRRGAAGSQRFGGGGGAGAGATEIRIGASYITTQLTITIGAGGAGGAGASSDNSDGSSGLTGEHTFVDFNGATKLVATRGSAGGGGTTSSGSGGTAQAGTMRTSQGGSGAGGGVSTGASGLHPTGIGCPGGPSGGGINTSNVAASGGIGLSPALFASVINAASSAWSGGSAALGQNAGNGDSGPVYGYGGAGGGASENGYASGAGGNGGSGYVRVLVWS